MSINRKLGKRQGCLFSVFCRSSRDPRLPWRGTENVLYTFQEGGKPIERDFNLDSLSLRSEMNSNT